MRTRMNRIRSGCAVLALAAWVSLPCMASCSSDNRATAGGRVEHPVEPSTNVTQEPVKAPPAPSVAPPEASAPATSLPSATPGVESPLSPSDLFEKLTGVKLSPRDKAYMDHPSERSTLFSEPFEKR